MNKYSQLYRLYLFRFVDGSRTGFCFVFRYLRRVRSAERLSLRVESQILYTDFYNGSSSAESGGDGVPIGQFCVQARRSRVLWSPLHYVSRTQSYGANVSKDPLIGAVLHDTHEIVRQIGNGGMGAVYEAVHKRLRNQRFAIKVLHAKMAENDKIFARFQREAEIATAVGHPSIIYVLDFYETDDGRPCMVMEYLEGEDLAQRLAREKGPLPMHEVLQIMEQVGGALQAVHDRGVMHRDMKPANIFLVESPDGERGIKVLDFGISKMHNSNTQLTGDHSVLGTPHYMSPEQGEGQIKDVDHLTDIFAMGTICYQMLSGTIPFDAATLPGVIYKICHVDPFPISEQVDNLPDAVHKVLSKALAKKREDRYQQVTDFVNDLKAAIEHNKFPGDEKSEETISEPDDEVIPSKPASEGESIDSANLTVVENSTGESLENENDSPSPKPDAHLAGEIEVEEGLDCGSDERIDDVRHADADEKVDRDDEDELSAAAGPPSEADCEEEAAKELAAKPTLIKEESTTLDTLSDTSGERCLPTVAEPNRRSRGWLAVAGIAVVLVVVGGTLFVRDRGDSTTGVSSGHSKPLAAKTPPGETKQPAKVGPPKAASPENKAVETNHEGKAAETEVKMVRVALELTPSDALVRLDEKLHSENPLMLEAGRTYHLDIEAQGFITHKRELKIASDTTLILALKADLNLDQKKRRKTRTKKALPFSGKLEEQKQPGEKRKATPFSGDL